MPFARGVSYVAVATSANTGWIVLTNDRWNGAMNSSGCVPIRQNIEPFEVPHSIPLASGGYAVASELVNIPHPPISDALGGRQFTVPPQELAAIEERLCLFLQLPRLLGPNPAKMRPAPSAKPYPYWSEVYFAGPAYEGQLKRYVIVSPDGWNAASGLVSLVRTTTRVKQDSAAFPDIQGGKARAACGDLTTIPGAAVIVDPHRRPTPQTTSLQDMVAIARGFAATHELAAAVARIAAPSPDRRS